MAESALKKFDKKPNVGTDPDAYEATMKKWEADTKAAQEKVDYWNKVAEANEGAASSEAAPAVEAPVAEKGEKGQKAVESVGENNESTISQTSDNVAEGGNAPGQSGASVNEEVGPFGRIYRQFKGKAKEAIQFLLGKKEGEAVGALSHPEIGDIDLVWGEEGTSNSDGYGLAKLAKYHPEVLDNLQEIINDMRVTKRSANRVQLESDTHQAAVRLTWDNKSKNWLLTAFEKKNSVSDNTTDTGETSDGGKQNDTATLQNTVSTDESTTQSANVQENTQKSGEEIQEPRSVEEVLENGDKRVTNYNSRGEVATVATERDGKVVSVDSYDEGVLFEHTEYDGDGVSTSVIRYDKNGNVVSTQVFENSGVEKSRSGKVNTHSVIKSENEKKALRKRTEKWAKKLGVKVNVLESYDEVTDEQAKGQILEGRTPGWFSNGEVYIYMPHLINEADLDRTIVHESVAHKGIKQMLGEEFGKFLDNVWNAMSVPAKAKYLSYVKAKKNATQADRRAAADEYVAALAEKVYKKQGLTAEEKTIWQKFAAWFRKKFNADEAKAEVLSKETLTDEDIAKMIRASYETLQSKKVDNEVASVDGETRFSKEVEEVNEKFNNELQQQIDGILPEGHIYQLGMPSEVLVATGIPELPIQLNSTKLQDKATGYGHDYDLEEVRDLVKALHDPLAVFAYGDKTKAQNIVVEIQSNDKNFVVGLALRPKVGGKILEINSIRNVFPKDNAEWLNWISQGKALYLDKKRIQTLIDQQRTNLADVDYLDLNSVTNVIKNFKNKEIKQENSSAEEGNGAKFRKVTPEMEAEYMSAVENGDIETAERLVREAAKMAMPDTKVVDEDGYPMVVYHGTTEDFNVFDKTKGRANMDIQGMFFSPWDLDAKGYGPNVRVFFLDINKPANESAGYEALKKFQGQNNAGVKAREYLVSLGYDGVNNEDQEFIAFEPNQIKSADAVTYDDNGYVIPLSERFNEEKSDIRFRKANENQEIFVSNARKAVEEIKQEKATPEQWIAMLKKNGGLKAGEEAWLGLEEWLNEKQGAVTKQEILDFIGENKIQIEEVEYANASEMEDFRIPLEKSHGKEFADKFFKAFDIEYGEFGIYDEQEAVDLYNEANGTDMRYDEDSYDVGAIVDWAEGIMKEVRGDVREIHDTRLGYTTDGLNNKREIALTVPTVESYNIGDYIHFGDAGNGRAVAWVRFGETTADTDETIAAKKAVNDYLAEMREKYNTLQGEETDAMTAEEIKHLQELTAKEIESGEKKARVLVIDEIQSKRHQDAREKGYSDTQAYEREKRVLDEKAQELFQRRKELIELLNSKYGSFTNYLKHVESSGVSSLIPNEDVMTPEEIKEYNETSQEGIIKEEAELRKKYREGVPSAPFEKNWHELAMKRMLRLAAEEGFDKVAWTTGEQQAERYNLGSVVNRIESNDTVDYDSTLGVDLVKQVVLFTRDGNAITLRLTPEGIVRASSQYNGHHISDIVGKELGNRIMTETDLVLKEQDLRIGGEGMKGFYDRMLPSFVSKYTKKWGAKVGEVTMPNLGENNTMHSVDVTPEMKDSVMEGQTMFRKGYAINGEPVTEEYVKAVVIANKWKKAHKGAAWYIIIKDGKRLREQLEKEGFKAEDIEDAEKFLKKGTLAAYFPTADRVLIFNTNATELEIKGYLWHENAHRAFGEIYT